MSIRYFAYGMVSLVALIWLTGWAFDWVAMPDGPEVGTVVDTYDRVPVYYNGRIGHSAGRHLTDDGYNLGLKWQNVEFVKRYYFEHYGHRMPDTYGHAKSFFDPAVPDGGYNKQRGLRQFSNPSALGPPAPGDILVLGRGYMRRYGHIGIVSKVRPDAVEMVQQNPGRGRASRTNYELLRLPGRRYEVGGAPVLGWLRKGR